MTDRQTFTMTEDDYQSMIKRISAAKSAPLIMLQCGMPRSVQEVANDCWEELGRKMGFDDKTIENIGSRLSFTAVPKEVTA